MLLLMNTWRWNQSMPKRVGVKISKLYNIHNIVNKKLEFISVMVSWFSYLLKFGTYCTRRPHLNNNILEIQYSFKAYSYV